ncbi:MAG: hypothetical protein KAT05_05435, partial [Spirochaetes bacterium]|nr:hypothetical protein [Spirochaetota bacterium]
MKNNIYPFFFIILIITFSFFSNNTGIADTLEDKNIYLWTMETEEEINSYSNAGTGTSFALNKNIVIQGKHSLEVIPGGKSSITKVVFDLTNEKIKLWQKAHEIAVNLYLPKENKLNLKKIFLVAGYEIENEFQALGFIFSKKNLQPGWNKLYFLLNDRMKKIKPSNNCKVFLSFTGFDNKNKKAPITEKFYIDGIFLCGNQGISKENLLNKVPDQIKKEAALLLKMKDKDLLEEISKKTFEFFWNEANPKNGLIKDRYSNKNLASIAATGWGLSAIPIGIERGWITKEEGYNRILTTLKTFINKRVEGKNGFFYHFVNMNTGKRVGNSEVSSIDTALLIAGAIFVGEYFKGTEIEELADKLYENVNWQWMMNNGKTLSMGWKPEGGFITSRWNAFNEGPIACILAIGSPSFPVSLKYWDELYRGIKVIETPKKAEYIYIADEVLCMYQYPQNWLDLRNKEDKYANYFNNTIIATLVNRQYAIDNNPEYKGYEKNIWGISPSDGPPRRGSGYYQAYGAVNNRNDGTITPNASIASLPFTPKLSMKAIRAMLTKYGPLIWSKYGFTSAFNVEWNWYSQDYIGIDQGNILLMIENHRTGLVWRYFMQNECIKNAMKKIGFKKKVSKYAVT